MRRVPIALNLRQVRGTAEMERRGTPIASDAIDPEPTCEVQDLERGIDVSLSPDLDGYELDCQRPRSQSNCRCELFCSDSGQTKA